MLDPTVSVGDLASLVVALVALVFSLYALRRSDRTGSAGTLVGVYDSIGQAWSRFLNATTETEQNFELAELLNRLEVACALTLGQGVHGTAKKLLDEYVESSLSMIVLDDAAPMALSRMLDRPTTFEHILRFIKIRSRRARMSDVIAMFEGRPDTAPKPSDLAAVGHPTDVTAVYPAPPASPP